MLRSLHAGVLSRSLIVSLALLTFLIPSSVRAEGDDLMKRYGTKLPPDEVEKLINSIAWTTSDAKGIGDPNAKKGGRIIMGSENAVPTLRYYGKNGNSALGHRIHKYLVYDTLLFLHHETLEWCPRLADKWHIADDKLTYFFHIDPEAKFADGKDVTAFDVVATWDLLTNEDIEDPFWNVQFDKFERPEALNADVVRVKAKSLEWKNFLLFANELFIYPQHIIGEIPAKEYLEKYNDTLMPGTNAYEIKSAETNVNIVLKRRKGWWAEKKPFTIGMQNFDEIEFQFIPDANLLFEKLKKGDIDFYYCNISKRWVFDFEIPQVEKGWLTKLKVFNHKPAGLQGIGFNIREGHMFEDVRLRQAFAHCMNRKLMLEKLFYNEYEYVDSSYPGQVYENPENPKVRYDLDKAVELLEEAGWAQDSRDSNDGAWLTKDGKIFEVTTYFDSKFQERWMTILQEDLAEVGIKLNLKQITWAEEVKKVDAREFEISNRAYAATIFPEPEQYHSRYADKTSNNNIWGLASPRIDEIIDLEKVEYDLEKRIKLVQEMDKVMADLYLWAFCWYAPHERIAAWNRFGYPEYVLPRFFLHYSATMYWWYDPDKARALEEAMAQDKALPVPPGEYHYWETKYPKSK